MSPNPLADEVWRAMAALVMDNRDSWNTDSKEEWQALSFSGFTRPAMMLARAGICEGRTVTGDARRILRTLKNGRPHSGQ